MISEPANPAPATRCEPGVKGNAHPRKATGTERRNEITQAPITTAQRGLYHSAVCQMTHRE